MRNLFSEEKGREQGPRKGRKESLPCRLLLEGTPRVLVRQSRKKQAWNQAGAFLALSELH